MTTTTTIFDPSLVKDDMLHPDEYTLEAYSDHRPSYRQGQDWSEPKTTGRFTFLTAVFGVGLICFSEAVGSVEALTVIGAIFAGLAFCGLLVTLALGGDVLALRLRARDDDQQLKNALAATEQERCQRQHGAAFPQDDAHTQFAAVVRELNGQVQVGVNMYKPVDKSYMHRSQVRHLLAGDPTRMLYTHRKDILPPVTFQPGQVAEVAAALSDAQQAAEQLEQRACDLYQDSYQQLLAAKQEQEAVQLDAAGTIAAVQGLPVAASKRRTR